MRSSCAPSFWRHAHRDRHLNRPAASCVYWQRNWSAKRAPDGFEFSQELPRPECLRPRVLLFLCVRASQFEASTSRGYARDYAIIRAICAHHLYSRTNETRRSTGPRSPCRCLVEHAKCPERCGWPSLASRSPLTTGSLLASKCCWCGIRCSVVDWR